VAELRHRPPDVARSTADTRNRQVREARSPLALAEAFFTDQQGRPASSTEAELLRKALQAAGQDGEL
jgi:exonuclease SbcD